MSEELDDEEFSSRHGVGHRQQQRPVFALTGHRIVGKDDAQKRQDVAADDDPIDDFEAPHPIVGCPGQGCPHGLT